MYNYGFVKCAIANFNGILANPQANAKKIEELIVLAENRGVKVLLFPELALTGYSCQDLFGTTDLIESSMRSFRELTFCKDVFTLVGTPIVVDGTLFNCAVAIQNGKIIGVVPKQYIPNYNEFYEKRWFSPYTDFSCKEIEFLGEKVPFGNIIFSSTIGYKLGVEICEDLWSVIPPSSYLALGGANIIANLSASNELVGKDEYRKELIKNQSARTISAYLYSSSGFSESTSDLVFGGSGYAFENGKELASLKRFQMNDQMKVFDVDIEYLSNERIKNQTFSDSKHNSKVTIGISGGLDSTLALLVCYEAFTKLNLDYKGIIGITMPGFGTTDRTYNNAVKLCEVLGITLKEIPIRDACIQHFKDIGHDPEIHDITYENVQARERTQILMDVANKMNAIVIGTGDLSELVLGWCTYNGDHMSMYNVNCSIPKTLVKYLIEWYAKFNCDKTELTEILMDIIDTPISPELLPSDGKLHP